MGRVYVAFFGRFQVEISPRSGVVLRSIQFSMENSDLGAKRAHTSTGTTPSKPKNKRPRARNESSPSIRKPLFQSPPDKQSTSISPNRRVAKSVLTKAKAYIVSPLRKSPVKRHNWTYEEERALVEFISVARTDPKYGLETTTEWPSYRESHCFWTDAAMHIKTSTSSNILLTNSRVRGRVCTFMKSKFKTLDAAEENYNLSLSVCLEELSLVHPKTRQKTPESNPATSLSTATSQESLNLKNIPQDLQEAIRNCLKKEISSLRQLVAELLISVSDVNVTNEIANFIFMELVKFHEIDTNPADFVSRSLEAMKFLQVSGKGNLLYKFAFCLSEKRHGTETRVFQLDRMPFGLIEYQLEFFSCTNIMQISLPPDYQVWYETMCSEFPTRFGRLFRGPMWSGVPKDLQKDPLTARVNIAAPSTRTVQKHTATSEFSTEPGLQLTAIKQLKEAHPNGRFWLKADACDIKSVLQHSMQGKWNGDCDLGNGALQTLRQEYEERVACLDVASMGRERNQLQQRLCEAMDALCEDVTFLSEGLRRADELYQKKFNSPNTSQSLLMQLCWETVEFNTLLQQAQAIKSQLNGLLLLLNPTCPRVDHVLASLKNLGQDLKEFFRNLYVKKRQPAATHVLILMVSEERRNKKPYALPIQYVPYHSIRDQYIRDLSKNVKLEMTKLGMKAVGMVTDGEFNSLRTQGETRPVHIWQVIHDARESVSRQKEGTLVKMLRKTGEDVNGDPLTEIYDEAIPKAVIQELNDLCVRNHWTMEDAVTYHRSTLVPHGYTPYSFRPNLPESYLDKLRSVVATYRYRHRISKFKEDGVDFCTFLYVPEVDPITGDVFHEREDHCHILKHIWKHTREGGPDFVDVTSFDAAMMDPNTGLTHAALVGERKQSVPDAERMISYLVAKFLRENGYVMEAYYVETVAGWHEAADGRGLTEIERCRKNYAMLNMVLDEWMPWHREIYDFSTIDVNRPVKGICGFSRETVIAVTTNIESIEFRRREGVEIGYEEHPRAGTSDDVEAIIALFHRYLGNIFTLKEFKACWRKVVREFCKRMDPELPFYFWTVNERYREWDEELPSFNVRPHVEDEDDVRNHPLRLHRLTVNRREDSSVFSVGHSFLPARNQGSIRQRLHRPVVHLPPIPN